jgi:type IX secretion system PorP/SprF family membrane protein
MNPIYLNPALTGNFDGDWRFTGNQKSQWRSVSRPYNTLALSAENKEELLLPGLYHALNFYQDAAGDGNYRTIEFNLTNSYQYYLNTDSTQSVTAGLQLGVNHKRVDISKLNFDSQFNGYTFDESIGTGEIFDTESITNFNLALGAIYTYKPEERKELVAGIGWFNLTSPTQSFFSNQDIKRNKRVVVHAKANYPLNYQLDLQPGIFTQFQGKYKELVIGSNLNYIYKDLRGEYVAPYVGIWYRNKDATYIVAGLYYNNWIGGISYDINMSELSPASHVRGGLEFSLQYIFHVFKPLDVKHRICPDYL